MCENCTTAAQHFTAGTATAGRPLQTSVENGTSPDWHAVAGPPKTNGERPADQFFSAFGNDENYPGT